MDKPTYGVADVAEILDRDISGIRAKAAKLAEEGGNALAYRNSSGWQITRRGFERLRNWTDGRRKSPSRMAALRAAEAD